MIDAVVFPGTFDPITRGHEDLIARASRLFPRVIVAVADNSNKTSWLSQSERVAMVASVVEDLEGVEVKALEGLLVDFVQQYDCKIILRGVRSIGDMSYEQQMAHVNQLLKPDVETVFLVANPNLEAVTSSMVREVMRYGGDISSLVSSSVKQLIDAKRG